MVGEKTQLEAQYFPIPRALIGESTQFRRFLKLARLLQSISHRRMSRPNETRGMNMTLFSNYAQHAFAAIGALAISALLFANTLATQAAEVHSVAGILA